MNKTISVLLAAGLSGIVGFSVDIAEAEACSPTEERVLWSIPDHGDIAPPETRIMLVLGGLRVDTQVVTVTDSNDEDVEGEELTFRTAGLFSSVREFVPEEPLPAGEYFVSVEYDSEWQDDFAFTFVVDDDYQAPAELNAVEFEWFHETHGQLTGSTCYMADEFHQIAVEPLDREPAYYEVIIQHEDGSERIQLLPPDAHGGDLRNYAVEDVECVDIRAVYLDGTQSPASEKCEPDKCKDYPEDEWVDLGSTDWDLVSGCSDEAEQGGCTAAPGSVPPVWILALVAIAMVRSVRKQ